MVKVQGELEIGLHAWEKVPVVRPKYNEFLVIPDNEKESGKIILEGIQKAVNIIRPYVMNCTIGMWTGRSTSYITVQPVTKDQKEWLIKNLIKINAGWACLVRDFDFDGRLQLMYHTPSPGDPIKKYKGFQKIGEIYNPEKKIQDYYEEDNFSFEEKMLKKMFYR